MDIKDLKGLMEAYQQVNAPQEVDEAVKGESSDRRRALAAERRAGIKPLSAKEGEKYASHKISQMAYTKRAKMGEEFDIFDVVLEFLQAEGFAETLEEAEWMMANMIDEEAIGIILGEAIYSEKGKAKAAEMIAKRSTPSGRAKSGKGANVAQIRQILGSGRGRFDREGLGGTPMTPTMAKNPIKKHNYDGTGNKAARRAAALKKEDFELWVNELVEEGYNLSDYTWDEMYDIYEAQLDEVSDRLARAARNTREKRYNASFGDGGMSANYSKQNAKKNMLNKTLASRAERTGSKIKPVDEEYVDEALTGDRYKKVMNKPGGTAYSRKVSADPSKRATRGGKGGESDFGAGDRGSGNKAARRAGTYQEEYVDEAQHARENPEKYEREQEKKSAPVRGEKTPMPPRGDKRREDFEKWYAKQMGR